MEEHKQKWDEQSENISGTAKVEANSFDLNDDDEEMKRRLARARQEYDRVERAPVEGKYDSIVDLIVEAKSE